MSNGPNQNENPLNDRAVAALCTLKSAQLKPSPYLLTRVIAHANTSHKKGRWWAFAWISSVAVACLVMVFVLSQTRSVPGQQLLGQPYMVRLDLTEMKGDGAQLAFVIVELGDERVRFSSNNRQVQEMKQLVLEWESLADRPYLPVVVEGLKGGRSDLVVKFVDVDGNVIKSKTIKLHFMDWAA